MRKLNQIKLRESYKPFSCAADLVRISEFFTNIFEK